MKRLKFSSSNGSGSMKEEEEEEEEVKTYEINTVNPSKYIYYYLIDCNLNGFVSLYSG